MDTSKEGQEPNHYYKPPGRSSASNKKWLQESNGRLDGHQGTKVNGKVNHYMGNTPNRLSRLPTQKWSTSGYPVQYSK